MNIQLRMKYLFITLFCLLLPLKHWAQEYNLSRYSTEDGLIQSQVRAMIQDHKGYLWLGTQGGLSKFDGLSFQNFSRAKYEGLEGGFIRALYEDENGIIWIGTASGLSRFDGVNMTSYQKDDGMISDEVFAIAGDRAGKIWAGHAGGISVMENGEITRNPYPWPHEGMQANVNCFLLHEDQAYIGTQTGLFELKDNKIIKADLPGIISTSVNAIMIDSQMNLWLGTDFGIHCFNPSRTQVQRFLPAPGPDGLPSARVYTLTEDYNGLIWAGTAEGLARYDGRSWKAEDFEDRSLQSIVRSSLVDKEGNVWIGTDGGGIRKLTQGVFTNFNVEKKMSSNIAKSFLQEDRGHIWISTYDKGINILVGNEVKFNFNRDNGLSGDGISYSFKDLAGDFWFATYENGISIYHHEDKEFKLLSTQTGLPSDTVYAIAQDSSEHAMWIGTYHGISILKDGELIKNYTTADGLTSNVVYSIQVASDGTIWIGTQDGLNRFNGQGFDTWYTPEIGKTVISMWEDSWARMWVATSEGLYVYADDKFQFVKISEVEGAHNVVSLTGEWTLFGGEATHLWAGTENGAYRLDLRKFQLGVRQKYEHFTQKDGLPTLECNANAIFQDRNGNMWIGTAEGAIVRPFGTKSGPEQAPTLEITRINLGLSETDWASQGYQLIPGTYLPQDLQLSYADNDLDFSFVGISFRSPKQVEYKFKLVGYDEEWQDETKRTNASYTNLSPGAYTFEVVAKKEGEAWDYTNPEQFSFRILSPWYQHPLFQLCVLLALAAAGYFIYWQVTETRRKRLEEQRIKDKAERLQLEHQALYAMMNPHFTFNALQSIQYFIHRKEKSAATKFLSSFAKLMRKNLESTRNEFISLDQELERLELYLGLEQMRFPEKFTYNIKVDHQVNTHDAMIPPMILQPFVENSIKHGIMPLETNGKIDVEVNSISEDYLCILLRDNGIGIEASKKRKTGRPSEHVSYGMSITQDRLELFGRMTGHPAEINVKELMTADGKVGGTEVELRLPVYEG